MLSEAPVEHDRAESVGRWHRYALVFRSLHDPPRNGMLGLSFNTRRDAKGLVLVQAIRDRTGHDSELTQRQCSGLVENYGVKIAGLLEPTAVPDQ